MSSRLGPFAGGWSGDGPERLTDGPLAALVPASTWLNSPPLSAATLHGRVVLVDFWTYTCVNWLRTLPYRQAWAEKYGGYGVVLVGVHTPEFDFEHDLGNVRRAVDELGANYPVAVDNDLGVWRAFENEYWPALYYLDVNGEIRHRHLGEGKYDQSERLIQRLLIEAGATGFRRDLVKADAMGCGRRLRGSLN